MGRIYTDGLMRWGSTLVATAGLAGLIAAPLVKARQSMNVQPVSPTEEALENDGAAEYAAWRAIGLRDENGRIDPDGTAKGLAQRNALVAFNAKYKSAKWSGGWQLIGSTTQAGRTLNLAIDPTNTNVMYAATAGGGLWKSTNAGVNWTLASDRWGSIATSVVTLDPNDHTKVWVGTGEWTINADAINGDGIFVSTNSGGSYTKLAASAGWDRISSISIDRNNSNNILVGVVSRLGGVRGVFKSTNGGSSFTQTFASPGYGATDVQLDSSGSRAIMASYDGSVYRLYYSSDAGSTWAEATGFTVVGNLDRPTLAFAPSDNKIVYAISGPANGKVYKSTDYGQTYSGPVTANIGIKGGQTWYNNPIWIDPTNPNRIVNGDVSNYMSTNGGATWAQISDWAQHYSNDNYPHADVHQIINDPNYNGTTNKTVYFCTDGGIFRKDDITSVSYTAGWTTLQYNQASMQAYGASGNTRGDVISGLQDNGTVFNANGNQASILVAGGDGGYCASDVFNPDYQYGAYVRGQVYQTKDNWGPNSFYITDGLTDAGSTVFNFIAPFTVSRANNGNVMYTGSNRLWRATNLKSIDYTSTPKVLPNWTVAVANVANSSISSLAIAPGNDDVVVVGYNNGWVTKSTNATTASNQGLGTNTVAVDGNGGGQPDPLPNRAVLSIWVGDSSANTFIVSLGGFSANNLWKTKNGGSTFTSISGSGAMALPSVPIRAVAVNPNDTDNIFVGTEVGIFKSDDGGLTWSTSNFGPSNVCTYDLQWMAGSSTKLIAATHGRGTWLLNVAAGVRPDSLVVDKPASVGGNTIQGTVTLNEAASAGGQVVVLSSDQPISDLPATVTVPAGQTTATFQFTPPGVDITQNYSIHAASAGVTVDAALTVAPATPLGLDISPSVVFSGAKPIATVTLNGQAGPSGLGVRLQDGTGLASQTLSFAAGASSKTATLIAPVVNSSRTYVASASARGILVNKSWTVNPNVITSLSIAPSVVGGNSLSVTVNLSGPAPNGVGIQISSDNAGVIPTANFVFPAGNTSATFSVPTKGVDVATPVRLTATDSIVNTSGSVTVTRAKLLSVGFSPSPVIGGKGVVCTLTLDGAVGPSARRVTMSSDSGFVTVPTFVFLLSQTSAVSFTVSTSAVSSQRVAKITATSDGVSQQASLTVNPISSVTSIALSTTTMVGGSRVWMAVYLDVPAPAGGIVVSLSSTVPAANIPSSLTVAPGSRAGLVSFTPSGVDSTIPGTVTAISGASQQSLDFVLQGSSFVSLSFSPSAADGGAKSIGTLRCDGTAGSGGRTVSLSSDSLCVVVPSYVTIPAGSSVVQFVANTTGVSADTTATVTATSTQTRTATLLVKAGVPIALNGPGSVTGGSSISLTVVLSGKAGPGGTVVSLSSDNVQAIPPSSVTVPAGATSASFLVATTSRPASTATITAQVGSSSVTKTFNIN